MVSSNHELLQQDLHPPLSRHEATVESDRCYFCYDAPCVTACPTGIDIPLFIRQISTDNVSGSARTIFNENILGGMCARVCPTETLCEQACVRNTAEDNPVRIGELQRYSTDHLMETGQQPFTPAASTGRKVAVVGAGPAGLACAHRLALYGHAVDILEARPKPGGLDEYGIAAYKTVDDFAQREVSYILSIGGIDVLHGKALGEDFTMDELKRDYDAVFLGMGLGAVNQLGIEGEELDGVDDAIDFIEELRQADDLSTLEVGAATIVIGGGMTAIDAAVQNKMLGCEEVTLAYRRGVEFMNASPFEQDLAKVNGVVVRNWLQPLRVIGENGRVSGVEFARTAVEDGRFGVTGETLILPCDRVLKAIGQKFDDSINSASGEATVVFEKGRIVVDADRRTSDEKVWAGGDCVVGGEDLTVAAVQDGKLAAESIHSMLAKG
ncbi:NAD(P)-dependent oxidoreductase [Granulosicoccus antarcticus]|uniref:dihydrouracil dehydrogenase (NAD(+)) n=1 Tax=Granulosicoccus antarcticus IMCC3135 TaxID=1192854 RepID=A0A2Z2NK03_9GAMM|nr:NAD(P)-dependent oxidoreductase [Granulosicoccus antarcticus]ASJ71722.1 NAD-dependent dihydropyrimidine dehydrogenase subunit PreT [Granulosicoccus antarcticus IMCC3135]